jgi:hypothetical protein
MSEQDTRPASRRCIGRHACETRNAFDEDRLTFGKAGSSSEAKRWHSTVRSREYRRRKKLGPQTRPVRVAPN